MNRAALAALAVTLCSCKDPALEFAPPAQRPDFDDHHLAAGRVVNMDDADAPGHFIRDISADLITSWRWTGQRPALRIRVRDHEHLKYTIDFTLPEITFKDTGPVSIAFLVNDHVLDRVRYTTHGFKHFEKPVPPEWMEDYKDAAVSAEIDKMWTSKLDGARFGFILTRIGLTP
jgi:hypothetical protein